MSWAGKVVGCCNERRRIVVEREPGRERLEYFECVTPTQPRLDWMIGSTISAACAGSSLLIDEIEVGERVGHTKFKLREAIKA